MDRPETLYASGPEGQVAYQVFGQGPRDIVFIADWLTQIDVLWDEPRVVRFFDRLASLGRVMVFDKRGTGASDRVPQGALPTIERWVDDVGVVMDAVGSKQASLVSWGFGGCMSMVFAATYPDRTSALIVVNGAACLTRRDDYPAGMPPQIVESALSLSSNYFGKKDNPLYRLRFPSLADDAAITGWFARMSRAAVSPAINDAMWRWGISVDIRGVLSAIRVPTLIMHRSNDGFIRATHGRYIADHIADAAFVELPGADDFFLGDSERALDEIQEFLTGDRPLPEIDRVLSTVIFTDLVSSTERAAELGDHRWRQVLDAHDQISHRQVDRFRGRLIKTTGDGVLATFDGPARAIGCATAIGSEVRKLGIEVRTGIHTGEVELRGEDVGGLAVNLAARVMAQAQANEILVSSTVKDLVIGSGIEFDDRGAHELKGVPGEWRLFAVKP